METARSELPDNGPTNVLDFLLERLACSDESDLCTVLSEADERTLRDLEEAHRTFGRRFAKVLPKLKTGELRPYLETDSAYTGPVWLRSGVVFGLNELDSQKNLWAFIDAVKHRLLYCHAIAIADPLYGLPGLAIAQDNLARSSGQPPNTRARNALQAYANFLLHMAPLVRSHVLALVRGPVMDDEYGSEYLQSRTLVEKKLADVLKARGELRRAGVLEMIEMAPSAQADHWKAMGISLNDPSNELLSSMYSTLAVERLSTSLCVAGYLRNQVTMYLPFRRDIHLVEDYLNSLNSPAMAESVKHEHAQLQQWADVDLPGLADLSPEDFLAIRKSDEFSLWRNDLQHALEAFSPPPSPVQIGPQLTLQDSNRQFREALSEARSKLLNGFEKSNTLFDLRMGATLLVVGSITTAIVTQVDPLTSAQLLAQFMGVIGGAVAGQSFDVVTRAGSAPPGPSRALLAHYVAGLRNPGN